MNATLSSLYNGILGWPEQALHQWAELALVSVCVCVCVCVCVLCACACACFENLDIHKKIGLTWMCGRPVKAAEIFWAAYYKINACTPPTPKTTCLYLLG